MGSISHAQPEIPGLGQRQEDGLPAQLGAGLLHGLLHQLPGDWAQELPDAHPAP